MPALRLPARGSLLVDIIFAEVAGDFIRNLGTVCFVVVPKMVESSHKE